MTKHELWTRIVEYGIATEQEIDLVTDICGYNEKVLNDIIFARTGYRDIEQYEESEGIDGEDVEPDYEPADIDSDMGFDPYLGSFSFDC